VKQVKFKICEVLHVSKATIAQSVRKVEVKISFMVINPLTTEQSHIFARILLATTRQKIELESYPKHPWIQQVFGTKSKKTLFVFGGEFSGGDVTIRACFRSFGHLWPALGPYSL